MKSKIICLIAVAAMFICGCGAAATSATVSMYDLFKEMLAADSSLPDMTTVSSNDDAAESNFSYLSDLDYSKVDSYFLSYSSEGKADEIAVIAVKDTNDVNEAKSTLEAQVDSRKKLYETYDTDQVERVNKAVVFTSGQYAVLIISDNSSEVKSAFEKFIENNNK